MAITRKRSRPGDNSNYSEKRLYPRKSLRTKIVFEDEHREGFIYFYSSDVSLGGIHLESDIPFKMGTKVFLHFQLASDLPTIRATGEIARLEKEMGPESPRASFVVMGMGIRFIDLVPGGESALADFLARP